MSPDLIARTCGYLGVFLTLIGLGIWGEPKFVVTPQQHFDSITLTLAMRDIPLDATTTATDPTEHTEPTAPPVPVATTDSNTDLAPVAESPAIVMPTDITPNALALTNAPAVSTPEPTTEPQTTVNTAPSSLETKIAPANASNTISTPPTPVLPIPHTESEPTKRPTTSATLAKQPPKQSTAKSVKSPKIKRPQPKSQYASTSKGNKSQTTTNNRAVSTQTDSATNAHATVAAKRPTPPKVEPQLRSQLSSLLVREIRSLLQYPSNAVRRKLEGTVIMEFTVKNGVVTSFHMRHSSGHKILDEAARKLAQRMVHFDTRLGSLNYRVQIPIKYELL